MFAMLVFVFLAIAGLAIDMGMATLTQHQMQVAVDTAALEGVRLRDFEGSQPLSNQRRRARVSQIVREVFDDDFVPTGPVAPNGSWPGSIGDNGDDLQLGAGPALQVSGGSGPMAASATVSVPSTPVWDDPVLETNDVNDQVGDQLSGTYLADRPHVEDGAYSRQDFSVASGPIGTRESLCFLVRMRRTTASNGLDHRPGISSAGSALPFLFSMGSLMRQSDASAWDPRGDGLTLRATSIAVARPTMRVGVPPRNADGSAIPDSAESGAPMMGVYPFAIEIDVWTDMVIHHHYSATVGHGDAGGIPLGEIQIAAGTPLISGPTHAAMSLGWMATTPPTSVGTVVVVPATLATLPSLSADQSRGFFAICATIPGSGNPRRVVGYGFGVASQAPGSSTITITKGLSTNYNDVRCWVASDNASAMLGPDAPPLSTAEWAAVFARSHHLVYGDPAVNPPPTGTAFLVTYDYQRIRKGSLLSPALVR